MPRTTYLRRDELVSAVATLRATTDLDSFAEAVREVLVSVFQPDKTWLYHLYDGRLHLPAVAYRGMEEQHLKELRDLIVRVHLYDPVQVRDIGRLVHYSTEVYDWYRDRPEMTERAYLEVFHRIGMDWMLGSFHMDGDLLLACIGLAQPYDAGNFTEYDLSAMEALHPHIDHALKACVENERRRRFGDAMAKAVEEHPSALFLLSEGEIVYANRSARHLVDTEVEGTHLWPLIERSDIARHVRTLAQGGMSDAPQALCRTESPPAGVGSVSIVDVDDWGLDHRRVGGKGHLQLAVVNRVAGSDARRLTTRERQVLEAVARSTTADEAAQGLGISPATLHVHLRNAYRKLGAGSLDEALAIVKLDLAGTPK